MQRSGIVRNIIPIAIEFRGYGCMDDFITEGRVDSQATYSADI